MGHQTSAAIARRKLRRFHDEHGRVFAHLKSGTVVATLAGEVSLAAGMPRADGRVDLVELLRLEAAAHRSQAETAAFLAECAEIRSDLGKVR